MQCWICIVTSIIKFLPFVLPKKSWKFSLSFGLMAILVSILKNVFCVATNIITILCFRWFFWTHVDDILDTLMYCVFCQILLLFIQECWTISLFYALSAILIICLQTSWFSKPSHIFMELLCSHNWKMFKRGYYTLALICVIFLYLCCSNGVVNMNGHVINDMLLYHAHTYFAWSLFCEGKNEYSSTFM
jgi:hypothetical protein